MSGLLEDWTRRWSFLLLAHVVAAIRLEGTTPLACPNGSSSRGTDSFSRTRSPAASPFGRKHRFHVTGRKQWLSLPSFNLLGRLAYLLGQCISSPRASIVSATSSRTAGFSQQEQILGSRSLATSFCTSGVKLG